MAMTNPNKDPRRIHTEDQFWADAGVHLDKVLAEVREKLPEIYEEGGNTDSSVVFAWLRHYIITAERQWGPVAHLTTVLMCAAAITRLVGAPLTNDVLAQLEKDMETGNDDH
jgi:hypothetical protein